MYKLITKLGLQFFGEGAGTGEGGGDGGASAQAVDGLASQNSNAPSLESLGVPKDKAEKYRQRKGINATETAQQINAHVDPVQESQQTVTADAKGEEPKQETPKSLKDILKENPQLNQEAQEMITGRVKNLNARLADVEPILEILGKNYGFDVSDLSKLDLKALSNKVTDDNKYYEDMAAEMGTDIETAKRINKLEREAAKVEREKEQTQNEMKMREHFNKLQQQALDLQQEIPSFNLEQELQNPAFMRMTSPDGGLTVAQAFHALHYKEINQFNQQQTAQNVAKALSNSIRAGGNMPTENGTVQRAASTVQQKAYHDMNAQERAEFVKQLKSGKKY